MLDSQQEKKMLSFGWLKAILKFVFVDSLVNLLGHLFEQPLVMWLFIGWGWVSVWVMLFSMFDTVGQL